MALSDDARQMIEEEESLVESILNSLQLQLEASSIKLQNESRRARQLTSELVAATRDEDKQMLASDEAVSHAVTHLKADDIKSLEKLLNTPYFARFAVDEQLPGGTSRTSEYRLGFAANPDCRIIDWRKAPISKLYYEYKEGDEFSEEIQGRERDGTISMRKAVEIKKGVLKKLTCRLGQFYKTNGQWEQAGGHLRSRAVGSASYGELPQILALITAEQFELITTDSETAVLIQGIAGSGKTTVALHRLAWLLHEDNSDVRPEDSLVLVLHRALQVYTDRTLPAMGIHGVRVVTFDDWAADTLRHILPASFLDAEQAPYRPERRPPRSVGRVYRSLAILKALEDYEKRSLERLCSALEAEVDWSAVPPGLQTLFNREKQSQTSSSQLLKTIQAGIDRGLKAMAAGHPAANALTEAGRVVARLASQTDYLQTVQHILANPEQILAHDTSRLLNHEVIAEAASRFAACIAEEAVDYSSEALLVRLAQLRSGAPLRRDGRAARYSHIVTDEIQEFSPVELACVLGAVPELKDVTLVGDVAQQSRDDHEFPGWQQLMQHWGFSSADSRYLSLTVSHRSTLPIMRLADAIQRRKTVTEGRPGRKPIWFATRHESKGIQAAISWLQKAIERYPNAITAVLCPSDREAKQVHSLLSPTFGAAVRIGDTHSFSFEDGILVTSIAQVKGLEFMNVLLWNPVDSFYPDSQAARNALYIAVTRAEENVCLVTWRRPSPVLPDVFSKLLRGIDLDVDEEETSPASRSAS